MSSRSEKVAMVIARIDELQEQIRACQDEISKLNLELADACKDLPMAQWVKISNRDKRKQTVIERIRSFVASRNGENVTRRMLVSEAGLCKTGLDASIQKLIAKGELRRISHGIYRAVACA